MGTLDSTAERRYSPFRTSIGNVIYVDFGFPETPELRTSRGDLIIVPGEDIIKTHAVELQHLYSIMEEQGFHLIPIETAYMLGENASLHDLVRKCHIFDAVDETSSIGPDRNSGKFKLYIANQENKENEIELEESASLYVTLSMLRSDKRRLFMGVD